MSGYNGDIGSLRFLAAHDIYQLTVKLLQSDDEADRGALDDAVMLLDVLSSYYTDDDDRFKKEMQGILEDRRKATNALARGMELDAATQEAFRWRELKAMFRSLCRQGVFVRQASQESEWIPQVKA